jgi:hypothetical protein
MPHGFGQGAWERAIEEATIVLKRRARSGQTIAYSDLATQLSAIRLDAHDLRFAHLLGDISVEQDEAGFGLLTVLVVHKGGDFKPGPGFFELAASRGRDVNDIDLCWTDEFRRVVVAHGGRA